MISTKSEVQYILLFFVYTIIAIIGQIVIKSLSSESYNKLVSKLFITKSEYEGKNQQVIVALHNIITSGFLLTVCLLLFGFYKYYARHRIEYANNWDPVKFIFGTNICRANNEPV